jgi:arginase
MSDDLRSTPKVLGYLGPAGDHNPNPVSSVPFLASATAAATDRETCLFGAAFAPVVQSSADHLEAARGLLTEYSEAVTGQLDAGHQLVCVNGRCATSLATVPRVMRAHPDCVLVWLDAHADLNVPGGSPTDYLGGMAVSGPLGWWDSGFGSGLTADRLVLVGTRSVDEAETTLISDHEIHVMPPEQTSPAALVELVAARPVLFHIDCDVLEPGLFRTDYSEPDGLSLEMVAALATGLAADSTIVGVEIAEWEGPGSNQAADLLSALAPLLLSRRS